MSVAILRQGDYLIASIQSDLSDGQVLALRDELAERIGRQRARGLIVDVGALDVIDSFVARALRSIAETAKLRGATTVIVGIQPDVAIAMVHFSLDLEPLRTALDVDVGRGEILLKPVYEDARHGLVVIAKDNGPGIRNVDAALEHGYASRRGLGLGLPGARSLMDEFEIDSDSDRGTTVTMTKWRVRDELERLRERRRGD